MGAFLLALLSSVFWGLSDFLGGFQARSMSVLGVLAVSQPAGLISIVVAVIAFGHGLPGGLSAAQACAAGIFAVTALGLLYVALARGSIVLVAPLAATGVAIPVLTGLARGESIGGLAAAGIVLASLGTIGSSWAPGGIGASRAHNAAVAAMALGAAVATGLYLTLLNLASRHNPLGATEIMRLTSCGIALAVFGGRAVLRRGGMVPRGPVLAARPGALTWLALIGVGLADTAAEICYATASGSGQLGIVAVLASLYPVMTVLLAVGVLRERVRPVQALAAACAMAGVVLLAAAAG